MERSEEGEKVDLLITYSDIPIRVYEHLCAIWAWMGRVCRTLKPWPEQGDSRTTSEPCEGWKSIRLNISDRKKQNLMRRIENCCLKAEAPTLCGDREKKKKCVHTASIRGLPSGPYK